LDWNGARQSVGLGEGRDMYYLGPNGARWLARLDRARGVLIHAPNGDFNASHPDDYMDYRNWSNQNVASPKLRDCGVTAAGAGAGTAAARPCDDPRTQAAMDQWLAQASPPENQRPGWNVRYDSWGRLVGRTPSTTISGLPQGVDTPLSRCEYLLSIASRLNSSNLGTLQAYLQQRLR
jgi:hypothetical protein